MSRFDEEPDGDPHGECALEIRRLEADIVRLRAELEFRWTDGYDSAKDYYRGQIVELEDRAEKAEAELAEARAKIGQWKAAFFTGEPLLDEKIAEIKLALDEFIGCCNDAAPREVAEGRKTLHTALDALRATPAEGRKALHAVLNALRKA